MWSKQFDYNEPVVTNTTLNKVTIPTNISDSEASSLLSLYPNPTKGSITLSYAAAEHGNIKVLSTDGRIVYFQQNIDFSNPVTLHLEMENLFHTGYYWQ